MHRMLSVSIVVLLFVTGLSAQERQEKGRTKVQTDDAKIVTWSGCLRASKAGFDLTEVTRGTSRTERKKESGTPSTVMLREVPDTIDLQKYVGRRVAITGATEKDVFEDIEVELQTKEQVGRSTTTAEAELEVDPKGHNILVPISIREISKTCQ